MKILLATDGSGPAQAAADFLMSFPLPAATEITVATVIREVLLYEELQDLPQEQRQAFGATRQAASDEARGMLDAQVERLRAAGFAVESKILVGRAAEQIVDLATQMKTDVVVVGSHGMGSARRFLLGSVSDRVFEYAPCSVLIVKTPEDGAPDQARFPQAGDQWRLLLAFDDSPPARKAVELCASLPLEGHTAVKAVTVMPMIHMYRLDIRQRLSWVWQGKKKAAEMALEWLRAEIDWKHVEVTTELLEHPDVAHAILDVAADQRSDLIIIGNKSRSAFDRFLLGSVTARLARHAHCSVLSVRTGE